MQKVILLCLLMSITAVTKAQLVTDTVNSNVFVVKDSRIDLLAKKKAEIN